MDKVRVGFRPAPRAPGHFGENTPMARTQTPRRQPRPLHVEPLENRWLPTGQHALLLAPVALLADPGPPALTAAPVSPAADNPAITADASGPTTENPPDGGSAQANPGDGSSLNGDASGLSQGDLSQGATDASAGAGGDTSATGDPGTVQAQGTTGTLGQGATPMLQDASVTDSTTLDQTAVITSAQGLTISSFSLGTGNQNGQQGDDSGSGNGGGDSGSTGDGSGTTDDQTTGTSGSTDGQTVSGTATQDPGTTDASGQTTVTQGNTQATAMQGNTSTTDTNTPNPAAVVRPMGPDPAPPSSGQPGGGDAAGAGKNPPANAGESQPPAPASHDPAMAAPKPQADAAPRLPLTLSPADAPKTVQRTLAVPEDLSGHADTTRVPDPHEAGEANAEKRTDGVKGNFSAPETPPPAAEAEGAVVRADDGSPRPDVQAAESAEAPAPARAVPTAGSVLLAAALPFDLPALEKGVHGFFAQLDQVSEQIVSAKYRAGLGPWLVALATAGVALEVARRKLRAVGDPACSEGDAEPTWSWLVTPVDELAPEPG